MVGDRVSHSTWANRGWSTPATFRRSQRVGEMARSQNARESEFDPQRLRVDPVTQALGGSQQRPVEPQLLLTGVTGEA